jgi:glutamate-1-semialdehyde 2,1-aminomutase
MERERSWERITEIGHKVRGTWETLSATHGVPIKTFGLPALSGYQIDSPDALAYKTLITQELLDRGFLAATGFYASMAHDDAVLARYFDALDAVFALVAKGVSGSDDVLARLRGPVCHAGFKRLN